MYPTLLASLQIFLSCSFNQGFFESFFFFFFCFVGAGKVVVTTSPQDTSEIAERVRDLQKIKSEDFGI